MRRLARLVPALAPLVVAALAACSTTFDDGDTNGSGPGATSEEDASSGGGQAGAGGTTAPGTGGATGTGATGTGGTGTGTGGTDAGGGGADPGTGNDAGDAMSGADAGGSGDDAGGGHDASDAATGSQADASDAAAGPSIVKVQGWSSLMTPGIHATWTVTATDTDGAADLASVTLSTQGVTVGTFAEGAPGTFTYDLTWDEINAAAPIETPEGGGSWTLFTLQVTDQEGRTAQQKFGITLECGVGPQAPAACAGVCTNLADDPNNCGRCGYVCTENGGTKCVSSVCEE